MLERCTRIWCVLPCTRLSFIYYFLKTNGFSERYMTFLRKELGYIKKNGTPVTIKADLKPEDTSLPFAGRWIKDVGRIHFRSCTREQIYFK